MKPRILYYDTLDSTNNLALELAKNGASEWTVVVTDYQTKGRGRFKRKWLCPRGRGLLFSLILRPSLKASSVSILTHLAAEAVRKTLEERFGLDAKLKRPNDVLVKGRKISGILTESSAYRERLEHVVVGIGLNVNHTPRELVKNATSIYAETKNETNPKEILGPILRHFQASYEKLAPSPRATGSSVCKYGEEHTLLSTKRTHRSYDCEAVVRGSRGKVAR